MGFVAQPPLVAAVSEAGAMFHSDGVQVAGRPFEDERVLAVAAAIEQGFGYRPPPLAVG